MWYSEWKFVKANYINVKDFYNRLEYKTYFPHLNSFVYKFQKKILTKHLI